MNRLGMWAAMILFLGGVAYAVTVAVGMVTYGLDRPIGDPVLQTLANKA